MDEQTKLFLKELSELSKKYNRYIDACGCCDSPWVEDGDGKEIGSDLTFGDDEQYKIVD